MKKFSIPSAALLAGLLVAGHASAQTDIISAKYGFATAAANFDFGAGVVGSSSVTAGLLPAAYWNLANDNAGDGYVGATNITSGNLVDENGVASGVVASLACDGTRYNGGGPGMGFAGASGNFSLYDGYALGNWSSDPLTLTLTGLNTADTYTLITYIDQANLGTGSTISGAVGAQTLYLKSMNSGGAFVAGTATTAGAATSGDYFEFDDITGLSTLIFTEANSQGCSLAGFQLVETTIPEPSTIWSLALGLMGLVGFQVSRRSRLTRS